MTALTLNGSAVAASTLAAAGKFFNTTGGSSGNTSTKVGSGTLFKQVFAKGTTTNQTGVSSIPTPTDSNFNGWMWDVTTLEGQLLQAGTLTPTIHLLASTGTTITPTVQWFKRTSGGVYTQLATVAGSSIALTTSSQALTFTPPSMSDTPFATGDKLVMWLWVNQTAGGATNSTISVVEATSASSAGVVSEAQTVTQNGYIPIVTYSFTELLIASANKPTNAYSAVVLADSPIRYYRLGEPSGPAFTDAGSQAQNGTPHGTLTYSQVGLITQDPDHAILFDGSTGYITLPATGLPTGASAWSMECWAQISATPTNFESLIDFGTRTTNEDAALFFDTAGKVNVGFDGGGNVLGTTISLNVPHHLVGTYDGTTIKLYIDGSLVGTPATTTGGIVAGAGIIGAVDSSGGLPFGGNIDEVAIYSSALSAVQVATHYSAGISSFGTLTTTETSLPTESLSAAESLLATETDFPAESLSASAFGNLQAWGIDALTASDSLLQTDTALPTESLTAQESILMADISLPTDMLTVNDTAFLTDESLSSEANSVSERFSGSGTSQAIESLATSDALLEVDGYVPLESLTASDSQAAGGAYIPLEGLTGVSSPLEWDVYLPSDDALMTDDSASTMTQNALGPTTTTYNFEDDLSSSDVFIGQTTGLTTDGLVATDILLLQDVAVWIETGSVIESLLAYVTMVPTESLLAIENMLATGSSLPIDLLSMSETLLEMSGYSGLEGLLVSESQGSNGTSLSLERLIGLTSPLEWDIYLPGDDALISDDSASTMTQDAVGGGLVTTTYAFVETLTASESIFVTIAALPLDSLTASSRLLESLSVLLTENLVIAESVLTTESSTSTTLLSASESLFQTSEALMIDGLSITRSVTIQGTGSLTESLVIATNLLIVDTDLSTDSLSTSAFGNVQTWGIDALTISESLLTMSTALPTESLPVSDSGLISHEGVFGEASNILDTLLLAQGYVPLDVLSTSDASTTGGTYRPGEDLSLLERLLVEEHISWVDMAMASDSFGEEIVPAAILSPYPLGSSPATYQGHTVVPTRPSGVYTVNGVILDSQPTVCTAPLEAQGVRFLIGSTFSLFFDRPTTLTQTLLDNGQTVSMTFALSNGQMVTGRVQVASTFVAATSFSVVCTLVSADVALAL